jgi:hypothetical protein
MTTSRIEYNAELDQFVSDYYAMGPEVRKDSDRDIAMAYIESCMVTENVSDTALEAEVEFLIPQINYYR